MSALVTDPDRHPSENGPGQPTKLNPALAQAIAGAVRASANISLACAYAHINRSTHQRWMKRGTAELHDLARDNVTTPDAITLSDINQETHPHAAYKLTIEKALADYQLENLALIGRAAAPHQVKTSKTTTKRDRDGNVVEETVETSTRDEQSWQAAAWLLERRFPQEYGRAQRIELSGPDGAPIEVSEESPGARLAKALGEMHARDQETRAALESVQAPIDLPADAIREAEPDAEGEDGLPE